MINVGILGTAHIARAFFGVPLKNAMMFGVASREKSKAETFGDEFNIPHRYGSYDDLLKDPAIDAVYIPLPQHLHREFVIKAARAGKHVLVEKPAALSSQEVREINKACNENGVFYMEAFMYRFKPLVRGLLEIVSSDRIGHIVYIDFNWCFNLKTLFRSKFRMEREQGGGALYDLGIYGADFLRLVTKAEPTLVSAHIHRESPSGVDIFSHSVFTVDEITATMTVAFNTDANYVAIGGEKGALFARSAFAGRGVEEALHIHLLGNDELIEEKFPAKNPYVAELEYFAECIEKNQQPVPGAENSLKNLLFLEQIFANAEEF